MKSILASLVALGLLAGAAQANPEPTADWKHTYKCYRCGH